MRRELGEIEADQLHALCVLCSHQWRSRSFLHLPVSLAHLCGDARLWLTPPYSDVPPASLPFHCAD